MSRSSKQNQSYKDHYTNNSVRSGPSMGDDEPDKPTVIKIIKKPKKQEPKEEPIDRVPHDCLSSRSPHRTLINAEHV